MIYENRALGKIERWRRAQEKLGYPLDWARVPASIKNFEDSPSGPKRKKTAEPKVTLKDRGFRSREASVARRRRTSKAGGDGHNRAGGLRVRLASSSSSRKEQEEEEEDAAKSGGEIRRDRSERRVFKVKASSAGALHRGGDEGRRRTRRRSGEQARVVSEPDDGRRQGRRRRAVEREPYWKAHEEFRDPPGRYHLPMFEEASSNSRSPAPSQTASWPDRRRWRYSGRWERPSRTVSTYSYGHGYAGSGSGYLRTRRPPGTGSSSGLRHRRPEMDREGGMVSTALRWAGRLLSS